MMYNFTPQGVCSRQISFEIDENNTIQNVQFTGGCNGNLKGISALVQGMSVQDAINRLEHIQCGMKGTSCPDQFAQALKQTL